MIDFCRREDLGLAPEVALRTSEIMFPTELERHLHRQNCSNKHGVVAALDATVGALGGMKILSLMYYRNYHHHLSGHFYA